MSKNHLWPAVIALLILAAGQVFTAKSVDIPTVRCYACDRHRPTQGIKYAIAQNDGAKVAICSTCQTTDRCFICEVPAGPESHRLEDGRVFCRVDFPVGIFEPREAEDILHETKRELARLFWRDGPQLPQTNVTVSVVTRDSLPKMLPGVVLYNNPRTGSFRSVLVTELFDINGRKLPMDKTIRIPRDKLSYRHQIYVLSGLSKQRMMAAFAHELGRAWMNENVPPALLPQINTPTKMAFCELIAYQLMDAMSAEYEKTYINANLQPHYQRNLKETDVPAAFNQSYAWFKENVIPKDTPTQTTNRPAINISNVPLEPQEQTEAGPPLPTGPTLPGEVTLKGLSGTTRRMAMINNASLVEGEAAKFHLAHTNVVVRLVKIRDSSVIVQIDGKESELFLSATPK